MDKKNADSPAKRKRHLEGVKLYLCIIFTIVFVYNITFELFVVSNQQELYICFPFVILQVFHLPPPL